MKQKVLKNFKERFIKRSKLISDYETKFYNLYMSAWKSDLLDDQEKNFILKQFWANGSVMALENDGMRLFTKYAPSNWNLYDFWNDCKPVTKGEIEGVTGKTFRNMVDCVICYANESHTPIREIVRGYIERIAEVDMTIQTNVFLHKIPYFANVDTSDKAQVEDLLESMMNDELAVFFNGTSPLQAAATGAPYIIDKLYSYRISLENELLTFLGFDNNQQQDYERLTVDQVNANNAIINQSKNSMQECLDQSDKNCKEVLGFGLGFKPAIEPVQSVHEEPQGKKEGE